MVVADGVKDHFLLFTALTHHQDILLDFILLTARPTAEHGNMTLRAKMIMVSVSLVMQVATRKLGLNIYILNVCMCM